MKELWVFGLGNPGAEYTDTKHNIGRSILENKAKRMDLAFKKIEKAEFFSWLEGETKITGIVSTQYMNTSGSAVRTLFEYLKPSENPLILVIQDDSDQISGNCKLVKGGGTAGHWGVDSVYKELFKYISASDIIRLKIGIRPVDNTLKSETFVLSKLSRLDANYSSILSNELFKEHTITHFVTGQIGLVQNVFNPLKYQ
jgi:peptidyl-tRNA hydrolase, PTH1 family